MKKKGFTLIELLAVIVILAIIALIAVPIVVNIINSSKEESLKRSVETYLSAVELGITRFNLKEKLTDATCEVQNSGNLDCDGKLVKVDMKNNVPISGTIVLEKGKIKNAINLYLENKFYSKNGNGDLVVSNEPSPSSLSFTGTIYRNSIEVLLTGKSIKPWCADIPGIFNSCQMNTFNVSVFNSKSECENAIETLNNDTSLNENERQLLSMATCNQQDIEYQTVSPLSKPITLNVYCRVNENTGYNTCINENWGYYTQSNCENSRMKTGDEVCVQGVIHPDFYLKHKVVNDIITSSYSCMKYNQNEVCLKEDTWSNYGNYDGMNNDTIYDVSDKNPTGNIKIISDMQDYFIEQGGSCDYNNITAVCMKSNLILGEEIGISVGTSVGGALCDIFDNGYATCYNHE